MCVQCACEGPVTCLPFSVKAFQAAQSRSATIRVPIRPATEDRRTERQTKLGLKKKKKKTVPANFKCVTKKMVRLFPLAKLAGKLSVFSPASTLLGGGENESCAFETACRRTAPVLARRDSWYTIKKKPENKSYIKQKKIRGLCFLLKLEFYRNVPRHPKC